MITNILSNYKKDKDFYRRLFILLFGGRGSACFAGK